MNEYWHITVICCVMCVDSSRIQIRFVGFLLESIISQCILALKSTLGPLWHLTFFICQKKLFKALAVSAHCMLTACWGSLQSRSWILSFHKHVLHSFPKLLDVLGSYFQISATCDVPTETSPTRALWVCVVTCTENIWTWTLMAKYHHFILPPSKHVQVSSAGLSHWLLAVHQRRNASVHKSIHQSSKPSTNKLRKQHGISLADIKCQTKT